MKKIFLLLVLFFISSCSSITSYKQASNNEKQEPYDSIDNYDLSETNEKRLVVAILLPLSGKAEKIGNMMLNSAQLAMFNNNINNIIIKPYDTKGTSFGAVDAINEAIRDRVDIVVGPLFTQSTKAILDIAYTNDLLVLSFSDNQDLLSEKYPNIYLMGFTPKQEIDRIISYLIDYKNFYGFSAMFPNDIYGSTVSKMFKEVISRKDAKIVKTEFYSKNDTNLEKKVNNLLGTNTFKDEVYEKYEADQALAKAEGLSTDIEFKYTDEDKIYSDALLLPDSGSELLNIAEYVANYAGKNKPLLIGTSKWLNSNLYNNINFDNTLFVAPNPNGYSEFEDEYFEAYQSYPLRVGSLAYDALTAVIESYAKAQDKENIKYALENYKGFEGFNGKFRFLSDGMLDRKLAIIKIINGRFEIVDYNDEPFLKY
ncbi:MAG TPA: penicillin-binding protein activator [Rickettsiales bacterium]|nr:penicillin-binding protein activator [Rickettsiales bacterium]